MRWLFFGVTLILLQARSASATFAYSHLRNHPSNDYSPGDAVRPAMPFLCIQALVPNTVVALTSTYSFDVGSKPFLCLTTGVWRKCLEKNGGYNPIVALKYIVDYNHAIVSQGLALEEFWGWAYLEVDKSGEREHALTNNAARAILEKAGDCVWVVGSRDYKGELIQDLMNSFDGTYLDIVGQDTGDLSSVASAKGERRLSLGRSPTTHLQFVAEGQIAVGGWLQSMSDGILVLDMEEPYPCVAYGFAGLFSGIPELKKIGIDMELADVDTFGEKVFEDAKTLTLPATKGDFAITLPFYRTVEVPTPDPDDAPWITYNVVIKDENRKVRVSSYPTGATSGYDGLFKACETLESADIEVLNGVISPGYCQFAGMFSGCSALRELNWNLVISGEIGEESFASTFASCYVLTECPLVGFNPLIQTDDDIAENRHRLGGYCFGGMFSDCYNMFCDGLELNIDTPVGSIGGGSNFYAMFTNCRKLKSFSLPAGHVPDGAYDRMFAGCTGLEILSCGLTNQFAAGSTGYWLSDASSNGVFLCSEVVYDNLSTNYYERGASSIPEGWEFRRLAKP